MIWPFTEIDQLRNVIDDLRARNRQEVDEHRRTMAAWAKDSADLNARIEERTKELEALKKKLAPEGPFMTCDCGSHAFITAAHLIGWKKGENGMLPVPLGATVQCRQCARVWHVDDQGMEVAKRVPQPTEERAKRPPKDDSDLRWAK